MRSLTASSNDVIVVIQNQGNSPVVDAFWVDAYVNPSPAPPVLYQFGDLWWGLNADNGGVPMAPGQAITLTLDGPFLAGGNPFPIAVGSPIYAQVDSFGTYYSYDEIYESNENNNVKGPELSVAGLASPPFGNSRGAACKAEGLPPRK